MQYKIAGALRYYILFSVTSPLFPTANKLGVNFLTTRRDHHLQVPHLKMSQLKASLAMMSLLKRSLEKMSLLKGSAWRAA